MKQNKRTTRLRDGSSRCWSSIWRRIIAISASKELTQKTGVARQTFYCNFRSKDDILLLKIDELFDAYLDAVRGIVASDDGDIRPVVETFSCV